MFSTIFYWINTVPVQGTPRALVVIGIVLAFAGTLYSLWEGVFSAARWFQKVLR